MWLLICIVRFDGQRPSDWQQRLNWPRQEVVTASQRRIWTRYIKSVFLRYIPFWKQPPTSTHEEADDLHATYTETQTTQHCDHLMKATTLPL